METADDEGMRYHTAASDLLHPDDRTQYSSHPFYKSQAANLTNATQTPAGIPSGHPRPLRVAQYGAGLGEDQESVGRVEGRADDWPTTSKESSG